MPAASLIDLYDRLANAPDERTRARVIAEAFEALETRYPHLPDLATRQHLSETELKLLREIEQVRADLTTEIEKVRADLTMKIEQVRADLSIEIARVQGRLLQWSFVFWLTQFAAIMALM
ncbi:MAG: hypothetical protein N2Z63_02190, partial [Thiobacillaceae bacterium]|nr:hypothetical protein [Thiobacillaceae bacterium]